MVIKNSSKVVKKSVNKIENKKIQPKTNKKVIKTTTKKTIKKVTKKIKLIKIHKKQIPNLNYGVLHARAGDRDGVSIVMQQIEDVMHEEMKVPRQNISYLVGKSGSNNNRIFKNKILYDATKLRKLTEKEYQTGFGGEISEELERAISKAQEVITNFIKRKKIDVIIAHNTCHPVNFIYSVAVSRYYRDAIKNNERTPKYLLWWHDSHMERKVFENPAKDVERYLLQGIPGDKVEYIFFINSTQFEIAHSYFKKLDEQSKGYSDTIYKNHDVVYNTTDTFIENYSDLEKDTESHRIDKFFEDFKIKELLKKRDKKLKDVVFCLQHTRMVGRKRIDFALEYAFGLLDKLNKRKRKNKKLLYFLISGHSTTDGTKQKIKKQYKELCKKYGECANEFHLEFAENYDKKTDIIFEEYPRLIAKLGGISTYFSEIEGYGNNLLEVLASGLIPVVYEYPVFKSDVAKNKFKLISTNEFKVNDKLLDDTIKILESQRQRKIWINRNLRILRRNLPHKLIARKLKRGIIRKRMHI